MSFCRLHCCHFLVDTFRDSDDSTRQKYAAILFENGQVVDLVADAMEAKYPLHLRVLKLIHASACRSNVKLELV